MLKLLLKIVVTAVALWISCLLPGITAGGGSIGHRALGLVAVAIVFGIVNAILKPIIKTVGCGFYVLTIGLVSFVVNGLLLLLTSWIAGKLGLGFHVDNFGWAVLGAVIVGLVGFLLHVLIPDRYDEGERPPRERSA